MKEITLSETRQIQLDILSKVHFFCQENNLRYSLGGGTLLGAVRHKGYIPWDDDIDIMLPRPDYEILIKRFDGFDSNLSLQHFKNDDACHILYAKIFDNRTVLIQDDLVNGVYIDVFPIDGLPRPDMLDNYLKKQQKLKLLLAKTTKFYLFQRKNRFISRLKYSFKCLIYPQRTHIIAMIDDLHNSYSFEMSDYAGAITGRYGQKECMKADIFNNYVLLPFENRMYYCIAEYDKYLTEHYGNYMQLPPIEQQYSLHNHLAYWK